MFIRISDVTRERAGVLSPEHIKERLAMPELYYSTSISDFIKNQDEIIETGYRPFKPGSQFKYQSIVCFQSCYIRKKPTEPDYEANIEEFEKQKNLLSLKILNRKNSKALEEIMKEAQEFYRTLFPKIANAELYDQSQNSTPLIIADDQKDVPEGGVYLVQIIYHPFSRFSRLWDYQTHSDIPTPDKKTSPSLIELLKLEPAIQTI